MTSAYPDSYYADDVAQPAQRTPFTGTARVDMLVVGGGYTGLSAALHLAEAGARVMLLDAARVGFAASGRNGGQIHSGFRRDQRTLEKWLGKARARGLWQLAEEAKALVRARAAKHGIACALTDGVIIAAHSQRWVRTLRRDTRHLNEHYGYALARTLDADETNALIGTKIYFGGEYDGGGGHLQPLAFTLGLAKAAENAGVQIHEDSRVLTLDTDGDGVRAQLEHGIVVADHVILASDAAIPELAPLLAPYLATVVGHIVATERLPGELRATILPGNAAVADTRNVIDYYRLSADGRLLFSGGERVMRPAKDIVRFVRPHMLRVFPQLREIAITHTWHGIVGITRTRMPHFGQLGKRVLFGYGYSGHGVALSLMGGKLLAEAALGKSDGFELLASVPAKKFPGGQRLRKPLVKAALFGLKLQDKI